MPVDSNLPEPRRRRGRRDNGLDAAAYVEVRDVDPRVGEEMLDLLRGVGVAAFLEPKVDNDPYRWGAALPSPPKDRLYVDRDGQETAREILEHPDLASAHAAAGASVAAVPDAVREERSRAQRLELDNSDVDARFAEMIAGFTRSDVPDAPARDDQVGVEPPDRPAETRPAETDPDPIAADSAHAADEAPTRPGRTTPPADGSASVDDPLIWRGPTGPIGPAADDPAEHYNPPEPPPWRAPSGQAQLGILVLILGAVLLFFPDLVGLSGEASVFLGVVGIAGGVGLLVLRLHKGDRDDDDDGAVV